jgi:hypothetical protein
VKKFWKVVCVLLFVVYAAIFIVDFSMFYWPSIPLSPKPAEGRIYPLNNHGRYTYMNRREYLLDEDGRLIGFLLLGGIMAICYFVDPFDFKGRQRRYRRPPAEFKG